MIPIAVGKSESGPGNLLLDAATRADGGDRAKQIISGSEEQINGLGLTVNFHRWCLKKECYLTELLRTFNHAISCTPSSIVVNLKFQWNRDLAIRLELLKILDMLS